MVAMARAEEPRHIHVLTSGDRARETVLVDALRIYTHDLGRTVTTGGSAPTSLDPAELDKLSASARAAGDEVLVWYGRERPVLCALRPDAPSAELRETPVEPGDPLSTARTLALKVRALIAPHAGEAKWTVPPELAPYAQTESPSAQMSTQTPTSPEPSAPPKPEPTPEPKPKLESPAPPPIAVQVAAPKPRRTWLEVTATYGITLPTTTDFLRHGFTVKLAVPLGRLLALSADASFFVSEPSAAVSTSTVSARVWPVGLALAVRLRRPKWQLSGGPRISLQILDVDATNPDGRAGSARRYSAGLGAFVEAAWLFSRHAALVGSFGAEALVPRQKFWPDQRSASTDLGWVQFAFNGGFMFSIP
jgi:hypothetical protein